MKPLKRFRLRLSRSDALLAISIVGMAAGFTTAHGSRRRLVQSALRVPDVDGCRGLRIPSRSHGPPAQSHRCRRGDRTRIREHAPEWIIAADDTQVTGLLRGHDLSEFVKQLEESAKGAPVVLGDVPGAITRDAIDSSYR